MGIVPLLLAGIYFFLSSTALVWNTTLLCGALASALLSRAAVTFIVVPLINIGRTEQVSELQTEHFVQPSRSQTG
jgi:hypothetical protein